MKTGSTALNYGMKENKLARSLNCTKEEALTLIDAYLTTYPAISEFYESAKDVVYAKGCSYTLLGRIRRHPEIMSHVTMDRWSAERKATNLAIQGCKSPESELLTSIGYVPLKELELRGKPPLIQCEGNIAYNYSVLKTGVKECVYIETTLGSDTVSTEHRYMVFDEKTNGLKFEKLHNIAIGDVVLGAFPTQVGADPPRCSVTEAELIGILLGNGSYTQDRNFDICIGNNHEYGEYVKDVLRHAFGQNLHIGKRKSTGSKGESWVLKVSRKPIRKRFDELGLKQVSGLNKRVPEWVLRQPDDIRAAVLRGLMDTDGGISGDTLGFCNKTEDLSNKVFLLLASFGIEARFAKCKDAAYRVNIRRDQLASYLELVGSAVTHKRKHAQAQFRAKRSGYPLPKALVKRVFQLIRFTDVYKNATKGQQAHIFRLKVGSGSAHACIHYLEQLPTTGEVLNLLDLCSRPWAELRRRTVVGPLETMDVEIHGEDHSYISRGFVQHNTAADTLRLAMINISRANLEYKYGCKALLQVHDELMFECPVETADEATAEIKHLMEHPFPTDLAVPLDVSIGKGPAWDKAK